MQVRINALQTHLQIYKKVFIYFINSFISFHLIYYYGYLNFNSLYYLSLFQKTKYIFRCLVIAFNVKAILYLNVSITFFETFKVRLIFSLKEDRLETEKRKSPSRDRFIILQMTGLQWIIVEHNLFICGHNV